MEEPQKVPIALTIIVYLMYIGMGLGALFILYEIWVMIPFHLINYGKLFESNYQKFGYAIAIFVLFKIARYAVADNIKDTSSWRQIKTYLICIGIIFFLSSMFAYKLGSHTENCETDYLELPVMKLPTTSLQNPQG